MERASLLRAVLAVGLTVCARAQGADEPGPWDIHLYRQRPYLTVEAIQRNYGFETLDRERDRFVLRSGAALLEGRVGETGARLNRLRYDLHHPVEFRGGHRLVSAYDLTNVIDLLLRPADHMQARELKTVYVQAAPDPSGTRPEAKDMVFALQRALGDFGLVVRVLPENAAGVVGNSLQVEEGGATAWIRLHGNGALPAHQVRCSLLAPPESPKRNAGKDEARRRAVYLGNLYDAESLALATLIQSGLLFGPATKIQPVADGGIAQTLTDPFQQASGAAVEVEWGEEFDRDHLLKAMVAGILRYRAFLDVQVRHAGIMEKGKRKRFVLKGTGLRLQAEEPGLEVRVQVVAGEEASPEDPFEDLEVQCFVFTSSGAGGIDLLDTPPPRIDAGDPERWKEQRSGEMILHYPMTPETVGEARGPSFGYIVRLVHRKTVEDTVASPRGLLNQLWRFTTLYP